MIWYPKAKHLDRAMWNWLLWKRIVAAIAGCRGDYLDPITRGYTAGVPIATSHWLPPQASRYTLPPPPPPPPPPPKHTHTHTEWVQASLLEGTFGIRLHSYHHQNRTAHALHHVVIQVTVDCFTPHEVTYLRVGRMPSFVTYDMSRRTCLGINKCRPIQSFLSDHNRLKQ